MVVLSDICVIWIYLFTVLSSSYGIINDSSINSPDHGKNVIHVLNTCDKRYLKGEIGFIGKLGSNDT